MNFHKLIFSVAIFFVLIPYVGDNDFWLHLRTGEIMVEEGYFPRTDVLSFANEGKEWVNHEWLAQIFFYLTFKYGGFLSVILLTALAGTLLFVLVTWRKRISFLMLPFLFLIAYSLKPFIVPRPQLFAYLFLLSLILVIEWHNRTKNKNIILVLPLVLFLWSNFHASVILAVPILFFALFFEKERKWLLIGTLVGIGLTLTNPFGYKLYWHALQPLRFSQAYHSLIETQPIHKSFQWPAILLTHLAIIFTILWHVFKERLSVLRKYELAVFAMLMAMPFVAVKYTPFAWAAVMPIFFKTVPNIGKNKAINGAIVGIVVVSVLLYISDKNLLKNPYDEWPKEMVGFIENNNIRGNAYYPYSWNGYFAWETKAPVLLNVALADMGGDVFWDAVDLDKGERVEEVIDKHNLSVVISQPWTILPYSLSLRDDWSLVYWDNYGVVFLRKGQANDGVIDKYGLSIKYFNDSVEGVLKKYKTPEIPALLRNYEEAIKRKPGLLLARYRLGLIYQLLGDCAKAIEQFKELTKIDYKLASPHFRLAECYSKIGDLKSAVAEKELADKFEGNERWWKGRR